MRAHEAAGFCLIAVFYAARKIFFFFMQCILYISMILLVNCVMKSK